MCMLLDGKEEEALVLCRRDTELLVGWRGTEWLVVSGKAKGQDGLDTATLAVTLAAEEGPLEVGVGGTLVENVSHLSYKMYLVKRTLARAIAISCTKGKK